MIRAFLESLHAGNRFRLVQEDALPEALWADDKSAAHRFQHLRQKALVRAEGSALQCDIRDVRLYAFLMKHLLLTAFPERNELLLLRLYGGQLFHKRLHQRSLDI